MKAVYFCFTLFLIWSCQKPSERPCWKNAGSPQLETRQLGAFQHLHVHPHLQVVLIQDSLDYIEVEAGAHLVPFIETKISSDTLLVRDLNRCHFLRYRHEKQVLKIHFTQLKSIYYEGSDTLSTQGTWHFEQLLLSLHEGAGHLNLAVAGNALELRNNYGWPDLQLSGTLSTLYADIDGNGSLQAKTLAVKDSILFLSASSVSSYLKAESCKLKTELRGEGNLYVYGTPSLLLKSEYQKGRVKLL
ncbi:MAG: hypothetical protein RLZZ301_1891 [Bacteroidota bacterium]|jgi:hypothetical protein